MQGLRVHLTGSAARHCYDVLLAAAHSFVRALAEQVIARGGGLVLGGGAEPRGENGDPYIFDWTALEVIADVPDPAPEWPALRPERFVVVASQRGLEKVPDDRAAIWERCRKRSDFELDLAPPGWRMAGIIRERQVLRGDILVMLGGGAGAEHLAELYRDEGKPVIPIYAELGAFSEDGNGGSRFLHARALADPGAWFRLRDGAGSAVGRLSALRLTADADTADLAKEVVEVLADLRPRSAFTDAGYTSDWRVVNAANFGLPQNRERLIVVGSRDGRLFEWPMPSQHSEHRSMAGAHAKRIYLDPLFTPDVEPAVAVMDAIHDLPEIAAGESATEYRAGVELTAYERRMRAGSKELTLHIATAHSKRMLEIIRHAGANRSSIPEGMTTSGFSSCYSRLDPNKPSVTLTVNFVHPASNKCIHPFQDRALTPREGARLQGFPDRFEFRGNRTQVVKQIGNAVPPLLGETIARALMDQW